MLSIIELTEKKYIDGLGMVVHVYKFPATWEAEKEDHSCPGKISARLLSGEKNSKRTGGVAQ
jgi:hypothetical protein